MWAVVAASLALTAPDLHWEAFLRQHYIRAEQNWDRYPLNFTNRFRLAWVRDTERPLGENLRGHFSRGGRRWVATDADPTERPFVPSPSAVSAVGRLLECAPQLGAVQHELFVHEVISLPDGELISYFVVRPDASRLVTLDSFLFRSADGCWCADTAPAQVDLDFGGPHRVVWDVLVIANRSFVVVARYDYEALSMEVYTVDGHLLKRICEFTFAYLGG